ncbi:unnamed protein product, partial [Brassica oleracea]
LGARPSYAWRSIIHGRELLKAGLVKKIGDGRDTRVWLDNWLVDPVPRPPKYRQDAVVDLTLTVHDLIDAPSNSWNINLVHQVIAEEDVELVVNSKFAINRSDSVIWVFLNIHYLISCSQKQSIGVSVRLSFPWLLWHIWKARNKFCFEQIRPVTSEVVTLAMEESGVWLQLNGHLKEIGEGLHVDPGKSHLWSKPPVSWVKCNIGSSWDSSSLFGGALLHSRRSFNCVSSAVQMDLMALAWASSAVVDLKLKNVIFEFSSAEAAMVIQNPLLSPFNYKNCYEILRSVQAIVRSKLQLVSVTSNNAASAIAVSVTRDLRHHSYVASNGPQCLAPLLSAEAAPR